MSPIMLPINCPSKTLTEMIPIAMSMFMAASILLVFELRYAEPPRRSPYRTSIIMSELKRPVESNVSDETGSP